MRSIFTVERRKDFQGEFTRFFEDIVKGTIVETSSGARFKMIKYLEYSIRTWPYRCGTDSISGFLLGIGVDITAPKSQTDMLLFMELLINLLHWAVEVDKSEAPWTVDFVSGISDVEKETSRLLENASYILEQSCNMTIREKITNGDDYPPQYTISKRNEVVDAVVECNPEISEYLLGYLDVRNENNIGFKNQVLVEMYKYMEPKRKEYKSGIAGSVSEEFFTSMNTMGIRHYTKSQIHIHNRQEICDKLFLMGLFVLQSSDAIQYRDELKQMHNSDKRYACTA